MFRSLPAFGGDQRAVAEVVRGIMDGKTNNTGTLTLATGGALTTTLTDRRIGPDSVIVFVPASAAAFADYSPYGAFQDGTNKIDGILCIPNIPANSCCSSVFTL